MLVTTPELPAIKNMRLLLDTLDLLGTDPARRAVVLNRLDQKVGLQAGRAAEALRLAAGRCAARRPGGRRLDRAGRPLLLERRADTMRAVLRSFAEPSSGPAPHATDRPSPTVRLDRKVAA